MKLPTERKIKLGFGLALLLLTAIDIVRRRAESAFQADLANLEVKVQERTVELATVNEKLRNEIAELQKTEDALRQSEERYRNLVEISLNSITLTNMEGAVLRANDRAAELFDDLQHSNAELAIAYDTTLEGWSRAMDLRDEETEGHTKRVTDVALRLARALGLSEGDLVQVRRGALLHDMGKMGVPDAILRKPGPLSEEEWVIMRLHPVYAYQMLAPIPFLRSALDIPYCHHEKWDGTGYPQGLRGEQIPLAARIFSVVDVWDALRSDRPYRPAWPEEKVLEYIRTEAGTHFDPKVVEVFLSMEL
jgi:putative nucleotidyltransferase with HDIG domain